LIGYGFEVYSDVRSKHQLFKLTVEFIISCLIQWGNWLELLTLHTCISNRFATVILEVTEFVSTVPFAESGE
jgi:hypothetical protein